MSCMDLRTSAQLAEWRKKEMSARLRELCAISSSIINNTRKIQSQAHAILYSLDCDDDPRELKMRFLNGMKEIDEYVYVATEANLALQDFVNVSDSDPNLNTVPEPDTTTMGISKLNALNSNLLDMLSDPGLATSSPIPNKQKPKSPKIKDKDQLIDFSGSSQSIDNTSEINHVQSVEKNENTQLLPGQSREIPGQLHSMQINTKLPGQSREIPGQLHSMKINTELPGQSRELPGQLHSMQINTELPGQSREIPGHLQSMQINTELPGQSRAIPGKLHSMQINTELPGQSREIPGKLHSMQINTELPGQLREIPGQLHSMQINTELPGQSREIPGQLHSMQINTELPGQSREIPGQLHSMQINTELPGQSREIPGQLHSTQINTELPGQTRKTSKQLQKMQINTELPEQLRKITKQFQKMQFNTEIPGQSMEIPVHFQSLQIQNTPNSPISLRLALSKGNTLEIDRVYDAYVINSKELCVWVVTDNHDEMYYEFHSRLNNYYQGWKTFIPIEMLHNVTYCVAFVEQTSSWCRCFMLNPHYSETQALVYLMGTGVKILVRKETIMPLQPDFFTSTRICHLAGINSSDRSPTTLAAIANFIVQFMGCECKLEVANNTSEAVECYLRLENNSTINHMLVENGLAVHIAGQCTCDSVQEKILESQPASFATETLPPTNEAVGQDAQATATDCRIEDVTETRPRTSMNYSGPSYTSYEVENDTEWIVYDPKIPPPMLPEPGASINVYVSHVLNLNKVFVQIIDAPPRPQRERTFGNIQPPETLKDLAFLMNTRSIISFYRRLEVAPKPGDIVAAIYPVDRRYYRARVIMHNVHEQSLDVHFLDYGDHYSVLETAVFQLPPQFTHLPCQAISCTLSEIEVGNSIKPENMARMKNFLIAAVQDKVVKARVISHSSNASNELKISLYCPDGNNVAKKMAEGRVVGYKPCNIDVNDTTLTNGMSSSETWLVL